MMGPHTALGRGVGGCGGEHGVGLHGFGAYTVEHSSQLSNSETEVTQHPIFNKTNGPNPVRRTHIKQYFYATPATRTANRCSCRDSYRGKSTQNDHVTNHVTHTSRTLEKYQRQRSQSTAQYRTTVVLRHYTGTQSHTKRKPIARSPGCVRALSRDAKHGSPGAACV